MSKICYELKCKTLCNPALEANHSHGYARSKDKGLTVGTVYELISGKDMQDLGP